MATNHDLLLISGNFVDCEFPKDKKYLKKYFSTELQRSVIKYALLFGSPDNFTGHTGIKIMSHRAERLWQRAQEVMDAHKKARAAMDMSLLAQIEMGNLEI